MMKKEKGFKGFFEGNRKTLLLMIVALMVVNVFLYIGTADYKFLKDDFRLIVENPRIKDFKSFSSSLDSKFFAFPDFPYLHYWRPMALFSFYVDYQLHGVAPRGYHVFNIVLNCLNALLIFLVFYFVTGKPLYGFIISLFFSIHPCHVEAVSWISGRTDLLSSFFVLAALLFFILFLKHKKKLYYGLTLLFFIPGLLAKENAILFPLLAVLTVLLSNSGEEEEGAGKPSESRAKRFRSLLVTLPFWIIDFFFVLLHNQFSGMQNVLSEFSFKDIFVICKTIGAYTRIILLPFFPTPHFSMHYFDSHHIEYLAFFVLAVAILWFVFARRNQYRYTIFSFVFLVFLLPVIDPEIVPSYPKIVIRFAYIPSLIAGAFFLESFLLVKKKQAKIFIVGLLLLISGTWAFETISFQQFYKDTNSHYNGLLAHFPDDGSLLLPMALTKAGQRKYPEALALVSHALEVNYNDRWLDVSEMGGLLKANLLIVTGQPEQGKTMAQDILNRTAKNEMKYFAYVVLAKYHEKTKDYLASIGMLKMAQKVGETADLMYRLALANGRLSRFKEALKNLEKAKQLNPELPRYKQFKDYLQKLLQNQQQAGNK